MRQQTRELCIYNNNTGEKKILDWGNLSITFFMMFWCYCSMWSECTREWETQFWKNIIFLLLVHSWGAVLCFSTLESHKSIGEMEEWKTKSDFVSLLQLLCVCCSASMNSIHHLAPALVVEIDRKTFFSCCCDGKVGGAQVGKLKFYECQISLIHSRLKFNIVR